MKVPVVYARQLQQLKGARIVDLRSQSEFARDHVRGATSVPLFDDEQRAVIGTLYRQQSPEVAIQHGLQFVETKLGSFLERVVGRGFCAKTSMKFFRELSETLRSGDSAIEQIKYVGRPPKLVLYCWRGGMRSSSVAALLQALGATDVVLVSGGYKAYRKHVMNELAQLSLANKLIVLRGPTGVGKTRLLAEIERQHPGSCIDLEDLAQHRSSLLGDVGLEPVSKPEFDSRLLERVQNMGPPPWFIEGESRKVGDVEIPSRVFDGMEKGVHVGLSASMEFRVRMLCEDYLHSLKHKKELYQKIGGLKRALGKSVVDELKRELQKGHDEKVAASLLRLWYDKRYAHQEDLREWALHLSAENTAAAQRLWDFRSECLAALE